MPITQVENRKIQLLSLEHLIQKITLFLGYISFSDLIHLLWKLDRTLVSECLFSASFTTSVS